MSERGRAIPIATAVAVIAAAIAVDVLLGACGRAPTLPSPESLIVTINENGMSPAVFTGPRVTVEFVNQDSQVHDVRSNPHPGHTQCPELNVGAIQPGQRASILTPFSSGRSCGYHDETRPDDSRFQGSITVE